MGDLYVAASNITAALMAHAPEPFGELSQDEVIANAVAKFYKVLSEMKKQDRGNNS